MNPTVDGDGTPQAWTDADYAGWLAYHDQIVVRIEFATHPPGWPDAPPGEESWCMSIGASKLDLEWLKIQLMKIGARGSYELTATDRQHAWGASGSGAEIVLTLAEGLLSAAVWDLVLGLSDEIATRIRDRSDAELDYEVSDEQAVTSARGEVALSASSQCSASDLSLISVARIERNHFVIELRDVSSGITYEVVSESVGGAAVFLSRIRKTSFPTEHE